VPNGIPGVGARLPILFSEGVVKGRIDINSFVALTSTNHAKTYGLYPRKGTIAVGADADIAIWDPEIRHTLTHAMLKDGSDYTPYEGMEVTGWPVLTMVRGKVVVRDGVLEGSKGHGTHLARGVSAYA
jgi:dihydropyrimidinase